MVVAPIPTPVARPSWSMVDAFALLVDQVKTTPETGWLFWSNAVALNCCGLPRLIVAVGGLTSMRLTFGCGSMTVSVGWLLVAVAVPSEACAVMCAVP